MYLPLFLVLPLALVFAQDEGIDTSKPDTDSELTDEDFKNGKLVKSIPLNDTAMYNPNLFEGDIADPFTDVRSKRDTGRNAIRRQGARWPGGRIPYVLSNQFTSDGRATIAAAMEEIGRQTCIKFVPKSGNDNDYIRISVISGCFSMVGRTGGKQDLSLSNGCVYKGTVMHEMMHAIGFFHEQSRTDRDENIQIYWQNIDNRMWNQFEKYGIDTIDDLGTAYDLTSIMHYGPKAFSKNGQITIAATRGGQQVSRHEALSPNDAYKINALYGCSTGGGGGGTGGDGGETTGTGGSGGGGGQCADLPRYSLRDLDGKTIELQSKVCVA